METSPEPIVVVDQDLVSSEVRIFPESPATTHNPCPRDAAHMLLLVPVEQTLHPKPGSLVDTEEYACNSKPASPTICGCRPIPKAESTVQFRPSVEATFERAYEPVLYPAPATNRYPVHWMEPSWLPNAEADFVQEAPSLVVQAKASSSKATETPRPLVATPIRFGFPEIVWLAQCVPSVDTLTAPKPPTTINLDPSHTPVRSRSGVGSCTRCVHSAWAGIAAREMNPSRQAVSFMEDSFG